MAKNVLGVDWGGVLLYFDEKKFRKLIYEDKRGFLPELIDRHETHQILFRDMYKILLRDNFFKKYIAWEEFVRTCADCLAGVHEPMFSALSELKKSGRARLIAITDNNPFFFYLTTLKFPEIFPLFRENKEDRLVISFELRSVKTTGGPFVHAPSQCGFDRNTLAFVDNRADNIAKFAEICGDPDAGFLYKQTSKRNHAQFLKFLDRHFPKTKE